MANLIVPKNPGLVSPNGAPIGAAKEPDPDSIIPNVGAFMESQGVHTLPSTVTIKNAAGQHQVRVLAFPAPALARLMQVFTDGANVIRSLSEQFEKAQREVASFAKLAAKRRDMIKVHSDATRSVRLIAKARIAQLEAALENVIDACGGTEAGVLDDSRRVLEAAHAVWKEKVTL